VFVQDARKASRKLTLDFGLRFTWYTQWVQANRRAAAFSVERFDPAKAPLLFRPVRADNQRRAVNPLTGESLPAVYLGAFVPNTGDPVNGAVVSTDANYPKGFSRTSASLRCSTWPMSARWGGTWPRAGTSTRYRMGRGSRRRTPILQTPPPPSTTTSFARCPAWAASLTLQREG
jgi:hypothetical protein